MNVSTLQWDDTMCKFVHFITISVIIIIIYKPSILCTFIYILFFRFFDIPKNILPEIRSSSEIYGSMVRSVDTNILFYNTSKLTRCLLFRAVYSCVTIV